MRELSALREGWDEIRLIETRLMQGMSIQDSLEQWLVLQRTFEPQLQETAPIFTAQRRLSCRSACSAWLTGKPYMDDLSQSMHKIQTSFDTSGIASSVI